MRSSRTLIPVTMLAAALACRPAPPAGLSDADRTALRAATDSFVQRVRRADWPAAAKLFGQTAVFMPTQQRAVTGQANIEAWMKAFPPISAFDVKVVSVDGGGDIAYMAGIYIMTITPPGGKPIVDTGKYLTVSRRQPDGSWPIVADIFNSDLAPPKH